jgi:choice-of-anchor B domain-containing protein
MTLLYFLYTVELTNRLLYIRPLILSHLSIIKTMQNKQKKGPLSIIGFLSLFLLSSNLFAQSPTVNMRLRSKMSFPAKSGANICGYTSNGREYAIHTTDTMTYIIDVTNPDVPKVVRRITAAPSLWHEVKVYRNYAYITSENGIYGVQIVDLSRLPDSTGTIKNFQSDATRGLINVAATHALHIDTAKGFCYLFGGAHILASGVSVQGAAVLDIKTDPLNPRYVGNYNLKYIHDGYAENDTLYAGHIYDGTFAIIDFRDKSNPIVLSTTRTPTAFTHNTWLTTDHKTVLTADENCGSYLASYDVSNPQQPRFLDKIRTIAEENAIIHNTHVVNDYAVTSWYTEGVLITDVHRPSNIVNVAQYDAFDGDRGGFIGTWGVYPFFPSGNLVVSNITAGDFFVITPQYKRACYLEGTITDAATSQPLTGVRVKINSTDMDKMAESSLTGGYATGQVTAGSFAITYSKKGYVSQTRTVTLATAQVTTQNITLTPLRIFSASGKITATTDGTALPNVKVFFKSLTEELTASTDAQGNFIANIPEGEYAIYVGGWGVSSKYLGKQTITGNITNLSTQLQRNFQDDFWGNFGWKVAGNAQGSWERGTPLPIVVDSVLIQPNGDSPTDNDEVCFLTGNPGCRGVSNPVIGVVYLTSPIMKLRGFTDPQLTFNYWFSNRGGITPPDDMFEVLLSNGLREVKIWATGQSGTTWRPSPILKLKDYLPLTDSMAVTFKLADSAPNLNITEGAVDNFRLTDAAFPNAVQDFAETWRLTAYPNPFTQSLSIDYQLDKTSKNAEIKVLNALGQVVEAKKVLYTEGSFSVGFGLPTGVYFVKIEAEGKVSKAIRVVKN